MKDAYLAQALLWRWILRGRDSWCCAQKFVLHDCGCPGGLVVGDGGGLGGLVGLRVVLHDGDVLGGVEEGERASAQPRKIVLHDGGGLGGPVGGSGALRVVLRDGDVLGGVDNQLMEARV